MECLAKFAALMGMRCFVLLLGLPLFLGAAELRHFSSGENRVHLLELYSSEGCSSCPPAEQWLGELRDAPGLWRDFVPVAFHVDYWDRLGWRDRFARKEYTARQSAYSNSWHSDNVYTPEFVLDGAEWRKAQGGPPSAATLPAGVLTVDYLVTGFWRVSFVPAGDFDVHVARLAGGIVSAVRAGENSGHQLRHEFVVTELKSAHLTSGTVEMKLNDDATDGVTRRALAAWITRRGELAPIQATGGWLE